MQVLYFLGIVTEKANARFVLNEFRYMIMNAPLLVLTRLISDH